MSNTLTPGPVGTSGAPVNLYDGTLVRSVTPKPAPVNSTGMPLDPTLMLTDPYTTALVKAYAKSKSRPYAVKVLGSQSQAERTWAGYVVRAGGHFVFGGYTSHTGRLWNAADPDYRMCTFEATVKTFGLALGGDVSVNLIFFLNVGNLANVEGIEYGNGTELHLAVPAARLRKVASSIRRAHHFYEVVDHFDTLLDTAKELYKSVKGNKPFIHTVEVADAALKVGLTHGIQGAIDIRSVTGRGGYVDNL